VILAAAVFATATSFVAPKLTSKEARRYRTVLSDAASKGPNFAGHYTLVPIGCGTMCVHFGVIDETTGDVVFPKHGATIYWAGWPGEPYGPEFKKESDILLVRGSVDKEDAPEGTTWFRWNGSDFELVRFESRDQWHIAEATRKYADAIEHATPHDVASFYAKDGELLIPGVKPLVGRDAIDAFLAPFASQPKPHDVTMTTTTIATKPMTATASGMYSQVAPDGKTYSGTYDAEWTLEDGEWRIARLSMHPSPQKHD